MNDLGVVCKSLYDFWNLNARVFTDYGHSSLSDARLVKRPTKSSSAERKLENVRMSIYNALMGCFGSSTTADVNMK